MYFRFTMKRPTDRAARRADLPLEVRDAESVRACVQEVLDRKGRIDVLVNAGYTLIGALEETSVEKTMSLFERMVLLQTGPASVDRIGYHRDYAATPKIVWMNWR
jgi:NAD(P)-dependent dehydrogenase (short-subunit alcohol dehydrogenase family)